MDIVTQGLLGAVTASALSKPNTLRIAAIVGVVAGCLPDIDYFIQSTEDPLLNLQYHRHFTHSLLFAPIGGLLVALLFKLTIFKPIDFKTLALFACVAFSTGGLLDACTSYGTHLYWPFSNSRTSWRIVSIIDPFFSGVLIVALIASFLKRKPQFAIVSLSLLVCYLGISVWQQQRVLNRATELAFSRQHTIKSVIAKPSFGNIFLWRSLYETEDSYYVDAICASASGLRVFEGESTPKLDINTLTDKIPRESVLFKDLDRFRFFSEGFLILHPQLKNVIGDVRYAMLPQSISPLWGISYDPQAPNHHVDFSAYRKSTPAQRELFNEMLFKKCLFD